MFNYAKSTFRLFLIFTLSAMPVFAQTQVCAKVAAISVSVGTTGTIVAAGDKQIDICGFVVTGNTTQTGFQFIGGSVNLTPVLYTSANGNVTWPYQVPTFSVPSGTAVTMSCGTGSCTGFLTYRN